MPDQVRCPRCGLAITTTDIETSPKLFDSWSKTGETLTMARHVRSTYSGDGDGCLIALGRFLEAVAANQTDALRRVVDLDTDTEGESDDHAALYTAADIARRALGRPPRDGKEYRS